MISMAHEVTMNSRKLFTCIVILILLSVSLMPLAAESPSDGESFIYTFPGDGDMNTLVFTFSLEKEGYVLTDAPYCYGELVIPGEINSYSVVEIGDYVFYGNRNLTGELYLPSTVRRIGEYAFSDCSLEGDIFIPSSVEEIGKGAFSDSSFNGGLYINERLTVISEYAFANTELTGSLIIGGNIREIEEGAFMNCDFSGDLILSEGLESIGAYAFEGNEKLDCDIVLPSTLASLTASVFNYCTGLNGHYIMNSRGSYVMRGLEKVEVNN